MALRTVGAGETFKGLITTEAVPTAEYRATGPNVGDFVQIVHSGNVAFKVNSMAAGASLHLAQYPWGIVREVNSISNLLTVQWMNVKGVVNFQASGTLSVGKGLQAVATARNNKVSCIATVALTPKPFVVAIDTPASGYVQAFLI